MPSSISLEGLKVCKFTRNVTSSVLALSQLYVQLAQRNTGRGQECNYKHYVITHLAKIILADFNFGVFNPDCQLPSLIPHQIFWLYGMSCLHAQCVYNSSHVYIVKCTVIQARAPLASFPCANSVYQATPQGGGAWGRGQGTPSPQEKRNACVDN